MASKAIFGKIRKKKGTVFRAIRADGFRGLRIAERQFVLRKLHDRSFANIDPGAVKHSNNLDGYLPYDAEYQANETFDGCKTDVKMLAFYLPQFHTFPENDKWWGEGFTEWRHTKSCSEPRYKGHYQPRTPHADIGFYDLSDIEVMRRQAELAKAHGIYGFCFYYYWFSGKRLMEKPVDQLLRHPEIDLPFCLCWANENWTRAWDGLNSNILSAQEYSAHDDIQFILDMRCYLDDPRYIRIHGKPVVIVYSPGQIPSCKKTFSAWREVARETGIGEILIWTCATGNHTVENLNIANCVDAEVELPPHNMWFENIGVRGLKIASNNALIHNYQRLVEYADDNEKLLLRKAFQIMLPL